MAWCWLSQLSFSIPALFSGEVSKKHYSIVHHVREPSSLMMAVWMNVSLNERTIRENIAWWVALSALDVWAKYEQCAQSMHLVGIGWRTLHDGCRLLRTLDNGPSSTSATR
ncbi:hypothetical protein EDD18DRAFT_1174110 [Armillaria luteobubalina]|uniref:Secreted protein n=1 Tax=Armillaria luteobubalina TaxID=153913 RepID=A0AA39Q1A7_9AGAR|nr:hypothetical protein EDD18DRAFT_1174110 [Armillaria luteobubalina]